MNRSAIVCALLSAALFGLSTPAAKLLIGAVDPWLLAGLFYAGSGVGLAVLRLVLSRIGARREASLARRDAPWLAGAIFFGGILGPVLLMVGLSSTEASTASLLLTMEGVATALIAWFVFKENFDGRIAAGMTLIVLGAAILSWQGGASLKSVSGPAAVLGACLAWGIDNNLTRKVSLADPMQTAMLKGLVAGPVTFALALWNGAELTAVDAAFVAAGVGFLGYGVSLVLFVTALRHLGTARTGAYYSTAPFLGAVCAVAFLGEEPSAGLLVAGFFMGVGVWLHLTERHEHEHEHMPMAHNHRHVHDEHHRHAHGPNDPPGEPHTHSHAHVRLRHAHAHAPDGHHRHTH